MKNVFTALVALWCLQVGCARVVGTAENGRVALTAHVSLLKSSRENALSPRDAKASLEDFRIESGSKPALGEVCEVLFASARNFQFNMARERVPTVQLPTCRTGSSGRRCAGGFLLFGLPVGSS